MQVNTTPALVGKGLDFAEGVNFDQSGALYCVDVTDPHGSIWRMQPGQDLQPWARTGGHPNGSRFGPNGDLFVADCGRCQILRIAPASSAITVYADNCQGRAFQGPNDLCFGPDGALYFTDPANSSLTNRIGAVYVLPPGGEVALFATGLAFPNGLMVTPDGHTLVVGETFTGVLHRFSLAPEDKYRELPPLATLDPHDQGEHEAGPDGMAYGADDNLYVAHYNGGVVQVVAPDGALVASLTSGGQHPTNVAFWQDSLYVTEGKGGAVYRLDIGVREQPPFMRPW